MNIKNCCTCNCEETENSFGIKITSNKKEALKKITEGFRQLNCCDSDCFERCDCSNCCD